MFVWYVCECVCECMPPAKLCNCKTSLAKFLSSIVSIPIIFILKEKVYTLALCVERRVRRG